MSGLPERAPAPPARTGSTAAPRLRPAFRRHFVLRTLVPALLTAIVLGAVFCVVMLYATAGPAHAAVPAQPPAPESPSINIDLGGGENPRTLSISIILLLTVLSIAPSILLMMTSFTKIAVVLALTRQAIGTPTVPPNQVIAGLALFLSLFVMGPVLGQAWNEGIQPYMNDAGVSQGVALERAVGPIREFMLLHTGDDELNTMIDLSGEERPYDRGDTTLTTLIPAFVISELKAAFIIGFVIYIPFLVIDLVVASILMSMGMMMLPPIMISLPFKLLLFVMVDGWGIITSALVTSYVV